MKNKLNDLNDHLFAALERINDEDLTEDELALEIKRSKAVSAISNSIVANAQLVFDAHKFTHENNNSKRPLALPTLLGGSSNEL
ncbi:hypothetical protein [Neisseria sp. Ec49-e6-T10]|uniref:hypothetical protein n=1 Tax=Neisseria sp. Ec49-e6-T10 TaxID=3140744 RepID=UPI003EC02ACE